MKTILILGGFGFIGKNILSHIDCHRSNELEVIVFSRENDERMLPDFKCVKKIYSGDFSDSMSLKPVFEEQKIDLVIHLINTTVPSTSGNFKFDIESNLVPTIDFMNLMIKYGCKDIIYLSSGGAVYGNSLHRSTETDQNDPNSSYGIVKLAIERYLMLYSQQRLLNPLILRLSNPYGLYHTSMAQGIINVALRSAIYNKPFFVWGDGEAKKDYIFIGDFVVILFKLIDSKTVNQILNVGSGMTYSINEIMKEVRVVCPHFSWGYKEVKKSDVIKNELDISKLQSIIGDFKFLELKEGILKTKVWLELPIQLNN
jgi:UDP-glucose 4-epimerase